MKTDTRGWHRFASFIIYHQESECETPHYMRSLVLWHPAVSTFIEEYKLGKFIAWLAPEWIGGRVIWCTKCGTMEFQSKIANRIFTLVERYTGYEGPHTFFFFDGDAETLTDEEKKDFEFREIKDPDEENA